MASPNSRHRPLRSAPNTRRAPAPSEPEKQVLSSYVLGYITLQEANDLLHQLGGFLITICEYQLTNA